MTRVRERGARDAGYWNRVEAERRPSEADAWWRAHADRVNQALCVRWCPATPTGRTLKTDLFDEAAGDGLLAHLDEGSGGAVAVDHSIEIARHARARGATRGAVADVRRLPFATASFDLVVSNSTLDHFDRRSDVDAALVELHRVLAPGGQLVLTLDNPANLVVALRNALPFAVTHALGLVPYFVGATYGRRRGTAALARAGFRVRDTTSVLHCPRVLAIAAARLLASPARRRTRAGYLQWLARMEKLESWPSRWLTGHFVAWRAVKTGRATGAPPGS